MKKIILVLLAILLLISASACSGGEQNWNGTFYQHLDDHHILAFTFEREDSSDDIQVFKAEIMTDNGISMSSVRMSAQLINKSTAEDNGEYRFKLRGDTLTVEREYSEQDGGDFGTDFSGTYTRGAPVEETFDLDAADQDDDGKTAILVADFGDGLQGENRVEYAWEYEGPLDPTVLSRGLSVTTGLDFFVEGEITGDQAFIAWLDTSTLVAGLDEREQNEEFFFYDSVSLNWFMMDSLAATIKKNFPEVSEVYYSGENGEPVQFTNAEDMENQGLPALPVDLPYEGSAFFKAHAGGRGDM